MDKGKFIVFEGIDGAGTSTQARILTKYLQEKLHLEVFRTAEPSNGINGSILRNFLSGKIVFPENECFTKTLLALMFAADRIEHLTSDVVPHLQAGIHVVCERYYLSSYAYQMESDHSNMNWLYAINSRAIVPDLTIFLDICPEDAAKRRKKRDSLKEEKFENLDSAVQAVDNYKYAIEILKKKGLKIEIVDGSRSLVSVVSDVMCAVHRELPDLAPRVEEVSPEEISPQQEEG